MDLPELKNVCTISEGFFSHRIHLLDDGRFLFTYADSAGKCIYLQYIYDAVRSEIILLEDTTKTGGIAAIEYLHKFLPGLFLKERTLLLHGVLMEHEGKGYIISAPSGTGKSTHAHLWQQHKNALILNGDLSLCYKKKTGGSYRWTGFGSPWCGTSGEYMNREVPIAAVVSLERAAQNEASLLTPADAFKSMIVNLQLPSWDNTLAESGVDLFIELLQDIPVVRLRCLPDTGSIEVLHQLLKKL